MSIYEQIIFWWEHDPMSLILTILFCLMFYEGVLPALTEDLEEDDSDDLM